MLLALDHDIQGLNSAGGGIQPMTAALHCTEPFISAGFDFKNVEREVKHQTITVRDILTISFVQDSSDCI